MPRKSVRRLWKVTPKPQKGTPKRESKANQATGRDPRRVDQKLCSICRVKTEKEFDLRKEELKMKKEEMELRKNCSWKQLKNKPQQIKTCLKCLNIFRHNR